MIQYNLTQPFTLIKWIKNIFILQVFGSDGHANNIREVYTVEAVMFCTESIFECLFDSNRKNG